MKKVLVTGSQGFVGKHLVKKLKELGVEVVEVDILRGIDLMNYENLEQLEKVDIVIHLAAKTFVPFAAENSGLVYKTNIVGTLNILEYCRNKGVNKIIYVSSYVYGEPEYLPIDETHKTNIKNPYGRSKLIGEQLCINYFEDYGIIPLIFRPFNYMVPGRI